MRLGNRALERLYSVLRQAVERLREQRIGVALGEHERERAIDLDDIALLGNRFDADLAFSATIEERVDPLPGIVGALIGVEFPGRSPET